MKFKLGSLLEAIYFSKHVKCMKHFTYMNLLGSHLNPVRKVLLLSASFYKEAKPQIIWEASKW